jgi:drug/metabolite transporter (DMT)-like permease
MGIVAPVSAVLATAIPVIFNAFREGLPDNVILAGFGIAIAGIWLLSRPEELGVRPDGLGMAIMAGVGFGGFFITLDQISENAVFWPLVAGRITACLLLVAFLLVTRRPIELRRTWQGCSTRPVTCFFCWLSKTGGWTLQRYWARSIQQ